MVISHKGIMTLARKIAIREQPDTFDQDLVFERRFHCAMMCSGGCHFRWKTPLLPLEKAISQALAPVVTVSDGMIP